MIKMFTVYLLLIKEVVECCAQVQINITFYIFTHTRGFCCLELKHKLRFCASIFY
jgi:hypothetical protein